jgi:hypothetical protein
VGYMQKEAKLLLKESMDSMIVAIERFNSPHETGRVTSFLILLDHSFEMLLKAAILKKGGKIREPRQRITIYTKKCISNCLLDPKIKFLTPEQALTLQTLNGLRDSAQHHVIEISEPQLYLHAQSGITLYGDILKTIFNLDLRKELPSRVLPISTLAPQDICAIYASEIEEIKKLLAPGKRRKQEVLLRLKPLAVLESTIQGNVSQPSEGELKKVESLIIKGKSWEEIFPGVSSVTFSSDASDTTNVINLRLSKKVGAQVQFVPAGTNDSYPLAVKRVNELDYYCFGRDTLAKEVGLNGPKTSAIISVLNLKDDLACSKEFQIGGMKIRRYSIKAVEIIKTTLQQHPIEEIWRIYQKR